MYPVVVDIDEEFLLRELVDDDFDNFHELVGDLDTVAYVPMGPYCPTETTVVLDRLMNEATARPRDTYVLAIVIKGDELAGIVSLSIDDRSHRRMEIGFMIRTGYRGRGLTTRAVKAMVDFGFVHIGAHRIWGVCAPANGASAAVMRKAGFQYEGLLKDDLLIRGAWQDSELYAHIAPMRLPRAIVDGHEVGDQRTD